MAQAAKVRGEFWPQDNWGRIANAALPREKAARIAIEAAEVFTYADLSVVCDPIQRDPESPSHVTNPTVVIEVLSPSTERYDREQKRLYYLQLPSLQEYLLVAQDRCHVEMYRRCGEEWEQLNFGAGDTVPLASIDFALSVDELYGEAGLG